MNSAIKISSLTARIQLVEKVFLENLTKNASNKKRFKITFFPPPRGGKNKKYTFYTDCILAYSEDFL